MGIFPKVVVSIGLAIFGAIFILSSGSMMNNILHTLALSFIMNIDEIIMESYISTIVRKELDIIPTFVSHYSEGERMFLKYASHILNLTICLIVAIYLSYGLC